MLKNWNNLLIYRNIWNLKCSDHVFSGKEKFWHMFLVQNFRDSKNPSLVPLSPLPSIRKFPAKITCSFLIGLLVPRRPSALELNVRSWEAQPCEFVVEKTKVFPPFGRIFRGKNALLQLPDMHLMTLFKRFELLSKTSANSAHWC